VFVGEPFVSGAGGLPRPAPLFPWRVEFDDGAARGCSIPRFGGLVVACFSSGPESCGTVNNPKRDPAGPIATSGDRPDGPLVGQRLRPGKRQLRDWGRRSWTLGQSAPRAGCKTRKRQAAVAAREGSAQGETVFTRFMGVSFGAQSCAPSILRQGGGEAEGGRRNKWA